ncbi:CATRA conflict system CASPASE/TPR repeat-associated protein [Frankia sp. R82]|uniref:CATRA conflict system CASPASE/TPR repeat-associated protein n=1 Tax=Frankia sp. R82 TaxID=2950553 RepID=UPI0020449DE5|nr:CATRA conflict system CASPASE/TPR repeat-associated protein [Frankia sp. R82]MCM3884386.1 BN6_48550 family protein [Frankia sp. R82]
MDHSGAGGRAGLRSAELVVHVYAPFDGGPLGERGYGLLRGLWYACRTEFGLTSPATAVHVLTELPTSWRELPGRSLVAVQQAPGDGGGVFQTVLRRDHGLLGLSAVLAPTAAAAGTDVGTGQRPSGSDWSPLDARWERASAPWRSELLDEARIYQGLLPAFDALAHYPHAASGALARAIAPALPAFPRAVDWESRGVSTLSGFAVWEPGAGEDRRTQRRLVILAAAAREAGLGAWTWSAGDTAAPPLARYLAQAAKLRLQDRLWSRGTVAQSLRRRLDDASTQLGGYLTETALPAAVASSPAHDGGARVASLRVDLLRAVTVRTTVADLRRNVEVATANMRALTRREVIPTGYADPFSDDLQYAEHLAGLLADGEAYLRTASRRARELLRVCADLGLLPAAVPAAETALGLPASPPSVRFDLALSDEDRLILLDELAMVFAEPTAARQFVADVGAPRPSLPAFEGLSPRVWWGEVFHLLDHGIVAAPYRDLLRAALRRYPHNTAFLAVAARYRVPPSAPGAARAG